MRYYFRTFRRWLLRHQWLVMSILFVMSAETLVHIYSYEVSRPSQPLDEPFNRGCRKPDTDAPRENAAIVMLARNKERQGAVQSIKSLEKQFNRWFHYPIVFLNDDPWEQAFIDDLTRVASGNVTFEQIPKGMWGFPDWMDKSQARAMMKQQDDRGVLYGGMESYHHMCRFNSGLFFDVPALKQYKWYWRVEPDVEFVCAIPYDPFRAMAKNGKKYGFTVVLWELGSTVPTLFRKITDYKAKLKIPSTNMWNTMINPSWLPLPLRPFMSYFNHRDASGDSWNFCHFWSNFEIADLDWFRSDEYRKLFEYLDADGGFYNERWGDAPVHSLAAALFLKPEELHHFEDIGYVHDPFESCPKNMLGGQMSNSKLFGPGHWDKEYSDGVGCRCTCNPRPRFPGLYCSDRIMQALK